jgi:hypothetical protein
MADENELIPKDWIPAEAIAAPLLMSKNLEPMIKALERMAEDVRVASATIKDQKASMSDVNKAVAQLSKSENDLIATQQKLTTAIKDENAAFINQDKELNKLRQDFAKLRTEQERSAKEGKKLLDTIQKQAEELKRLEKAAKDAAKRSAELGDQFGALDSITGGWLGNLKKVGGELLTLAKNPFFIAIAAVTGVFMAAKNASEAYYTATLEGEEALALAQAKDAAFVNVFEKSWEEAGENIASRWENLKEAWRGIIQSFEAPETVAKQKAAVEALTNVEIERASLAKEHLRDRIDDAKTELAVLKLLEEEKDKEEFTAQERLDRRIQSNKLLRDQEEGDLELAKRDLELQRSIIAEISAKQKGTFDRSKSILDLTDEEIKAIGAKGEEITKLAALEEAYIKVEANAAAKRVSRLKLELTLRKEAHDAAKDWAAFLKKLPELMFGKEENKTALDNLRTWSQEGTMIEVTGSRERMEAARVELDEKLKFIEKYAKARAQYEKIENIATNLEEVRAVYDEFYFAIGNLQATFSANVQQDLKAQADALKESKAEELRIAGDNNEAKTAIEQKYTEKEKELKREQAKAANKLAKFEKATALIQAAIIEGQLILKALLVPTPTNIAAAIAGGIQIAAIAAKEPPPAYRKGTNYSKEGVALVGEEGPELVEKNGRAFLTPAKPTYMYLPKGSKVTPHNETMKKLASDGLQISDVAPKSSELAGLKKEMAKHTRVLEAKEFVKIEATEGGIRLALQSAARKEYRLGSLYK